MVKRPYSHSPSQSHSPMPSRAEPRLSATIPSLPRNLIIRIVRHLYSILLALRSLDSFSLLYNIYPLPQRHTIRNVRLPRPHRSPTYHANPGPKPWHPPQSPRLPKLHNRPHGHHHRREWHLRSLHAAGTIAVSATMEEDMVSKQKTTTNTKRPRGKR